MFVFRRSPILKKPLCVGGGYLWIDEQAALNCMCAVAHNAKNTLLPEWSYLFRDIFTFSTCFLFGDIHFCPWVCRCMPGCATGSLCFLTQYMSVLLVRKQTVQLCMQDLWESEYLKFCGSKLWGNLMRDHYRHDLWDLCTIIWDNLLMILTDVIYENIYAPSLQLCRQLGEKESHRPG